MVDATKEFILGNDTCKCCADIRYFESASRVNAYMCFFCASIFLFEAHWQLCDSCAVLPGSFRRTPFPAAATTVLPITKLTTATVYLLHLIFSQNVSPVDLMLMDMTGGGWLVIQSGKGLAKCQFCRSATCKWDGTAEALRILETTSRSSVIISLDDHHNHYNHVVYRTLITLALL